MNISKEQIMHIAALARLDITPQETVMFAEQIDKILGYIDLLNQVNTEGVIPTSHAVPLTNVMREDQETGHLDQETAFINAPAKEDGFFLVPKVMSTPTTLKGNGL